MSRRPLITVVIPTWNGATRVTATLDSLEQQTLDAELYEVVVVDDGSEDGTNAVVERYAAAHPALRLRCVRQPNGGVNAARNAGVKAASGDAVALLDDDERAPSDHLARAVELLDEHERVAGVGGPARDTGGDAHRTCANCTIADVSLPHTGQVTTDLLLGGNMIVRRSVFEDVGLFDEEISGRGDETEWFRRANRRFLYDDSLFIWHDKDDLSLRHLAAIQFRQGRAMPIAKAKMENGRNYPLKPQKVPRYLIHWLTQRCDKGFLLAIREIGATYESIRIRSRRAIDARRRRRGQHGQPEPTSRDRSIEDAADALMRSVTEPRTGDHVNGSSAHPVASDAPLFSVVIATRDRAHLLPRTLDAVLAQRCPAHQIVVVDDGSSDETPAVLATRASDRLLLERTEGVGVAAARNIGWQRTDSEFVVFLDDDDVPGESWLAELTALVDDDTGIVSCAALKLRADGTRKINPPRRLGALGSAIFLTGTFGVRRDVLTEAGGYMEGLTYGESTELSYRLLAAIERAGLQARSTPKPHLVVHEQALRRSKRDRHEAILKVLAAHPERFEDDPVARARLLSIAGVDAWRSGSRPTSRRLLFDAARATPTSARSWARFTGSLIGPVGDRLWQQSVEPDDQL